MRRAVGLGAGGEMQKPLGIAVVGGLAFSTAKTLSVVTAAGSIAPPVDPVTTIRNSPCQFVLDQLAPGRVQSWTCPGASRAERGACVHCPQPVLPGNVCFVPVFVASLQRRSA